MEASTSDLDDKVRRRAFELWQQHGSREGYESEFWLHAERELKGEGDGEGASAKADSHKSGSGSDGPG